MAGEVWFTERQTADVSLGLRIRTVLWQERTAYQELMVAETEAFGRMLALDGAVQTTERDEFFYHEMIAHVPLTVHPRPRRVAVIGGGDGGVVREILRHPDIEAAHLVEIDERVVAAADRFFPALSASLKDRRATVEFVDGIRWMEEQARGPLEWDVVIVDSTDPVGPATGLFGEAFYRTVHDALSPDGILVAQTESPVLQADLIQRTQANLRRVFPIVRLYLAPVPTYPSGWWSFSLASKRPTPEDARPLRLETRYWTPEVQRAAFVLPPMVQRLVQP
jgi:spermidine synthase